MMVQWIATIALASLALTGAANPVKVIKTSGVKIVHVIKRVGHALHP